MNGADCVVRTLMAAGVDVCFANPGTSEMALVAALDRAPGMKCILGLFEGVVTGAADGYARMAGKPAVCLLHCGPGLANGLANLHNARRAGVPLVNIVGDHATYHRAYFPPLAADAEAAARPFSHWVATATAAETIGHDVAAAIEAANAPPGKVASLIVPANIAWSEGASVRGVAPPPAAVAVPTDALRRVVEILKSGEPAAVMLGGSSSLEAGLSEAGKVAKLIGARLFGQMFNTRITRGPHLPALELVPYNVDMALEKLSGLKHIILCGARPPVAFFAYPGKPSSLAPPDCQFTVLAGEGEDGVGALAAVAEELGCGKISRPAPRKAAKPATGVLTPESIAQSVGALLPEGAVVVNEALTSGRNLFAMTADAAPHDWLELTGGAIGIGIPLATGAAVACPDRRTVCLQADGSAMYTLQGLWTQARENLNVTTVIYANRAYAILKQELVSLGVTEPGRNATDMMDLGRPDLDWVSLAKGMGVEGIRVRNAKQFNDAFKASLGRSGPFLIEAVI
ncbi:MAG: acetolactate synthase large subunit [Alphaproteobacteria bacterium]|nr:acetolactate synthase large subunit [Alphaproteobacteria bacterium]